MIFLLGVIVGLVIGNLYKDTTDKFLGFLKTKISAFTESKSEDKEDK